MTDTETVWETRHLRRHQASGPTAFAARGLAAVLGAALVLLAPLPNGASAEPPPLDARVVWVRGGRAYVAARDSLALAPRSRLTFLKKSKAIASGEIERIVDGGMAVARITSGSLDGEKKLDRLRILAEPPPGPRLLRVGYPARNRDRLGRACGSLTIAPARLPAGYRVEGEEPSYRLVRDVGDSTHTRWPDTLVVRTFADAADQEIAVERSELDVAVFWPGELSPHMREHPSWKDRLAWPLERGLIATLPESAPPESRCAIAHRAADAFRSLGRSLFRGDLDVARMGLAACGDSIVPGLAVRYEVDPSCPARPSIERILDRETPRARHDSTTPVVRVSCLDPRTFSIDDVIMAAPQCQLVCAARLLPHVRELGAGALVDLFDCVATERQP